MDVDVMRRVLLTSFSFVCRLSFSSFSASQGEKCSSHVWCRALAVSCSPGPSGFLPVEEWARVDACGGGCGGDVGRSLAVVVVVVLMMSGCCRVLLLLPW